MSGPEPGCDLGDDELTSSSATAQPEGQQPFASLERAITNGPPALASALALGRSEAVLRNVTRDLHRACVDLAGLDHLGEAITRLNASRHARPDAAGQLWNLAVMQVLSVLDAEHPQARRRSLRRPGSR